MIASWTIRLFHVPSGQPIKKNRSPLVAPCGIMRGRLVIGPIDERVEIKRIGRCEVHAGFGW